jgi:hypothetical protein
MLTLSDRSHHRLPLLLLFLTLAMEAKVDGTTILVTPTEAVLFRPAKTHINTKNQKNLVIEKDPCL